MITTIANIVRAKNRDAVDIPSSMFYDSDKKYTVDSVRMHLILEEDHELNADVTEHPVQDGSVVSDHIALALREGSLRALVSNHSVLHSAIHTDERTYRDIVDRKYLEPVNYVTTVWKKLEDVMNARKLVKIVTVLEVYDNVAITHIGAVRNGDSGDGQEFTINFKQVRKVGLKEDRITAVVSENMTKDIDKTTAPTVDSGQQVAQAASSPDSDFVFDEVEVR